jgi:SAM-dependent methyltransferase
MKRIQDGFPQLLLPMVSLKGKLVLEIGCGNGRYSEKIAPECGLLNAIDPSEMMLEIARSKGIRSCVFDQGGAESLEFEDELFDVVIFTLSLHHVPPQLMCRAIEEALRVVKKTGHVIFLEPGMEGSFFDAEIMFNACDGDERREKLAARQAILKHRGLAVVGELHDEVIVQFSSYGDFIASMLPKRRFGIIGRFLHKHNYKLRASRTTLVCKPEA